MILWRCLLLPALCCLDVRNNRIGMAFILYHSTGHVEKKEEETGLQQSQSWKNPMQRKGGRKKECEMMQKKREKSEVSQNIDD
ncbi:hypothetical protein QUC31_010390 [Theobroma cacao]